MIYQLQMQAETGTAVTTLLVAIIKGEIIRTRLTWCPTLL